MIVTVWGVKGQLVTLFALAVSMLLRGNFCAEKFHRWNLRSKSCVIVLSVCFCWCQGNPGTGPDIATGQGAGSDRHRSGPCECSSSGTATTVLGRRFGRLDQVWSTAMVSDICGLLVQWNDPHYYWYVAIVLVDISVKNGRWIAASWSVNSTLIFVPYITRSRPAGLIV